MQLLPPIISVLSSALQFLADHSEVIGPLMIGIAAAMVTFRTAQAAANVAELGALPIRAANTAAMFAQASANRALATQMAISNGQQVASRVAMLPATAQVIINTTALVAQRVAMVASRVAMGIATAAQWAWNAALSANPIALIVLAIAALVAGLIWFFTQTKLGQQIWSGFVSFLVGAWNWIKTAAVTIFTGLVAYFQFAWNTISSTAVAVWNAISGFISGAISRVRAIIVAVLSVIRAQWSAGLSVISSVARAIWGGIVGFVTGYVNAVRAVVLAVVNAIRSGWSAGWSAVSGAVRTAASLVQSIVSGMSSGVRSAIDGVLGFFRGIQGSVMSALSGAGQWLVSVGKNVIQGFINGAKSLGSSILNAVTAPIKDAINGAKSLLGIHSPSRVFRQIGDFVGQGLIKGLNGSAAGVRASARSMTNAILDAFDSKKITIGTRNRLLTVTSTANAQLASLADQRSVVAKKLAAANKQLTNATAARNKYRDSVTQGLSTVDVTASQTGAGIITALKTRLADTKAFTTVMSKLRKAGLDATTYQQFISAGVDALPLAQNLYAGGKGQVKQIASLQGQLKSASSTFANSAANDLYGAGVNAAKGLVNGLKSQQSAIAKQMQTIAASMVRATKTALGIHSPSRVYYGLGMNTGQGYLNALAAVTRPIRDATIQMLNPAGVTAPDLELDVPSARGYAAARDAIAAARASLPVEPAPDAATGRTGPLVEFSGNVGMDPKAILDEADERARRAAQLAGIDATKVLA